MRAGDQIRFCNNPGCERCDEHLRPWELLRKAGRDVCPVCHEEVVAREARPQPALRATSSPPEPLESMRRRDAP